MSTQDTDGRQELDACSDEELALRARDERCERAFAVLLTRHEPWLRGLAVNQTRRHGCNRQQRWDAQDVAVEALYEAVQKFDPAAASRPGAGSFRRWLGRIARSRIVDLYREWRRDESHLNRSLSVAAAWDAQVRSSVADHAGDCWADHDTTDPARLAAWQELLTDLDGEVEHLDQSARCLIELLVAGHPLSCIARALKLSRTTVGRRVGQLQAQLRFRFREWG